MDLAADSWRVLADLALSPGFTDEARELSRARAAVEGAPEVRQAKVEQLKRQVAGGEYNPDPREVAAKILERGF